MSGEPTDRLDRIVATFLPGVTARILDVKV